MFSLTYPPANKCTSVSRWLIILACSANAPQGRGRGSNAGLGPVRCRLLSASKVMRTSTVQRCSRWNNRAGRVSGDSDCSGPWTPRPPSPCLSLCSGSPLAQIDFLPSIEPPERYGSHPVYLSAELHISYGKRLYSTSARFGSIFYSALIDAATRKEAELIVFTVQS